MASSEQDQSNIRVTTEELLLALIALEVDKRENSNSDERVKTEVLLSGAGLGSSQIAKIMGKNPAAVRMVLSRSRAAKAPKGKSDGKA